VDDVEKAGGDGFTVNIGGGQVQCQKRAIIVSKETC